MSRIFHTDDLARLQKFPDVPAGFLKLVDIFFSRRSADSRPKPKVTIEELVKRRTSTVRLGETLYRVTCEEVKP